MWEGSRASAHLPFLGSLAMAIIDFSLSVGLLQATSFTDMNDSLNFVVKWLESLDLLYAPLFCSLGRLHLPRCRNQRVVNLLEKAIRRFRIPQGRVYSSAKRWILLSPA
jgi:hypothetical protein